MRHAGGLGLCWDPEWLAIIKATHASTPLGRRYGSLPAWGTPSAADTEAVRIALAKARDVEASSGRSMARVESGDALARDAESMQDDVLCEFPVHFPFAPTAPSYEPPFPGAEFEPPRDVPQPRFLPTNPQTQGLLSLLGLLHSGGLVSMAGAVPTRAGDAGLPCEVGAGGTAGGLTLSLAASARCSPPPDPAEIDIE